MHAIKYRRLSSYNSVIILAVLLLNLLILNVTTLKFAYSQAENTSAAESSTNASRVSNTNTNITVQSTGLSKFQPAPSLPPTSGGAPIVSKIMPEPQNPRGEKYAKVETDRLLSSARSHPQPSPSLFKNIPGQINAQSLLSTLNATTVSNKTTNLSNESLSASANTTTSNRTFSLLMSTPRIITTGPSYAGVTQREGRAFPPDVVIAVGSNFVFQAANNVGFVQTTDGGNVTKFRLEPFFNSGSNTIFDPIVVYDNSTKRFFVSVVDSTDGSVRIAVSPQDSAFLLDK
jgi:hypothetical protein